MSRPKPARQRAGLVLRDGLGEVAGLQVIAMRGDRIRAITRFENGVLPWFGLPRVLAD